MQPNESGKKQNGLSWSSSQLTKQSTPAVTPQVSAAPMSASTPRMSGTARYAGFVAAGVILGVLVAWGAGAWRSKPANTGTTTTVNTTDTKAPVLDTSGATIVAEGSDPSLLVMSPQAAGLSVAIDKAIVSEPTWVVVYEDNAGSPGNALGAALFFPDHQQGTVQLLRSTVAGKSYLVVKQVDNGDHRFSLKDDPILTEGGQTQWVTFSAN